MQTSAGSEAFWLKGLVQEGQAETAGFAFFGDTIFLTCRFKP